MMKHSINNLPALSELSVRIESQQLSGEIGSNRLPADHCKINAHNDLDAVYCWLNEYKDKPTTHRTYQKEAERLLLWCIYQKQKSLSSLDRGNLEEYFVFLDDPKPKELWCGKKGGRGQKRGEANWKPFTGGLSSATKTTTIAVINSLLTYLVDARYLDFNPLGLKRKKNKRNNNEEQRIILQDRILEMDEWQAIVESLYSMPEDTPHALDEKWRLKMLVSMLYFLGLRISELATHKWNSFRKINGKWWFFVKGKGDKLGKIPVNDELLSVIQGFREHLRFANPYPQADEDVPIIISWTSGQALTPRHMNKLLKDLALQAATKFCSNSEKTEKLKKFSAHWLRHLSATMQDRAGIKFGHIRTNHRHENDNTTRLYVHAIDDDRHNDMQNLSLTSFEENNNA